MFGEFLQVLIELPYCFAQTLVYALITYSMINFTWTAPKFFWYVFITFFSLLYFTYYGMMAVALTPNHQIAAIVASGFYSIFNLFSGFLIFRPVSEFLGPIFPFFYCNLLLTFSSLQRARVFNSLSILLKCGIGFSSVITISYNSNSKKYCTIIWTIFDPNIQSQFDIIFVCKSVLWSAKKA